ncbi:calcium-dependent phosphotriesterase superfamily protein [Striga asiatica]|uniref:Calcium-dependent phosphotriesterase superfamily protein n=1 Tax=Striga asiatica TaxID=4170 RepID=A0A5A7PMT6_STRAF|nr:calcium-dependent phosphotriesterase superfamily protein [Striga asiatica]
MQGKKGIYEKEDSTTIDSLHPPRQYRGRYHTTWSKNAREKEYMKRSIRVVVFVLTRHFHIFFNFPFLFSPHNFCLCSRRPSPGKFHFRRSAATLFLSFTLLYEISGADQARSLALASNFELLEKRREGKNKAGRRVDGDFRFSWWRDGGGVSDVGAVRDSDGMTDIASSNSERDIEQQRKKKSEAWSPSKKSKRQAMIAIKAATEYRLFEPPLSGDKARRLWL